MYVMSDKLIKVGIADMKIVRAPGCLITYALGSCIGICIYDPNIKLAGMIHIMLPDMPKTGDNNIMKYADTGIPEMVRKMENFGGRRPRMTAKIAGGAKMFNIPGDSALGNIGMRNTERVRAVLAKLGIRLIAQDTGADYARTMEFDSETGRVTLRSYGHPEKTF